MSRKTSMKKKTQKFVNRKLHFNAYKGKCKNGSRVRTTHRKKKKLAGKVKERGELIEEQDEKDSTSVLSGCKRKKRIRIAFMGRLPPQNELLIVKESESEFNFDPTSFCYACDTSRVTKRGTHNNSFIHNISSVLGSRISIHLSRVVYFFFVASKKSPDHDNVDSTQRHNSFPILRVCGNFRAHKIAIF